MIVYIVDDEPYVRESLLSLVRWNDIGVTAVMAYPSVKEALAACDCNVPDIIISDIMMPGVDGLEFSAIVNEKYPTVRFIILSGYSDFEYAKAALKNRVIRYLVKPISPAVIENAIKDMISEQKVQTPEVRTVSSYVYGYIKSYLCTASLKEAASELGMSQNHVASVLERETGMTFTQMLYEERMKEALALIRSNISKKEAMKAVGYSDMKSFRKALTHYLSVCNGRNADD